MISDVQSLRRDDLPIATADMARFLIGKTIVRQLGNSRLSGRIVETEAYPVGDSSSHAFRGQTRRNRSLFLERGYAYIYLSYGTSYMLNVSSDLDGNGAGVLIRAIEPVEGLEMMQQLRGISDPRYVARGPGRLTRALAIDLRCDGIDLCSSDELWLGTAIGAAKAIRQSVRIGVTRETGRRLRFYEKGSLFLSGPRSLSP